MKNEWAKEKEEIKGELREGQLEELKEKLALFVGGRYVVEKMAGEDWWLGQEIV